MKYRYSKEIYKNNYLSDLFPLALAFIAFLTFLFVAAITVDFLVAFIAMVIAVVSVISFRLIRISVIKDTYENGTIVRAVVTDVYHYRHTTVIELAFELNEEQVFRSVTLPATMDYKEYQLGRKVHVVVHPKRPRLSFIADFFGEPAADWNIHIERWTPNHPRWAEVMAIPEPGMDLESRALDFHLGIYTIVALLEDQVVGVLRFWTQEIGIDEDQPVTHYQGKPALEAKTVVFHVLEQHRRKGIATALQLEELRWAKELNLYQVRSRSDYDKVGNHGLKVALGFGISPGRYTVRGIDKSAYFVIPLKLDERILDILS